MRALGAIIAGGALLTGVAAAAAGPDGAALSLVWALPFAGLLLSIALLPVLAARLWHRHFGAIALGWALAFALPYGAVYGWNAAGQAVWHALALEYLPFIVLLYALFAVAGGILIRGDIPGAPAANTGLLAVGTLLASLLGTTGAAILLIRPLLRANAPRPRNAHVFVFFIFLVGNIGGALTPLGDPPLYLGFLNGVGFFWTTQHLALPTALSCALLLAVFYVIDRRYASREPPRPAPAHRRPLEILGAHNIVFLLAIAATVVGTSAIPRQLGFVLYGATIPLDGLVRSAVLVAIAAASLATTRRAIRIENAFNWEPIVEVALLFIGIFITIVPVLAILQAGPQGALADLVGLVNRPDGSHDPARYFWLTGVLSAFLDNAPTYLVFFNLAGGDAAQLMHELRPTLAAISAGAVFFGAATYVGNAPNFMVKAICEERGVKMPGFFAFMAWSAAILLPLFALNTWLFFS